MDTKLTVTCFAAIIRLLMFIAYQVATEPSNKLIAVEKLADQALQGLGKVGK